MKKKTPRNYFIFKVVAGINSASIDANNDVSNTSFSFDKKPGYEFGFEAEAIMPFNRDKIRIVLLPSYQNFKSSTQYTIIYDTKADVTVDYKAVELPLGVRYYFFLNSKTKIFLTGLVVPSITFNSSNIEVKSIINQENIKLELNSLLNYAFGIGISYQRFSIEFRYNSRREIAQQYLSWVAGYNNVSFKLGYDLFKF